MCYAIVAKEQHAEMKADIQMANEWRRVAVIAEQQGIWSNVFGADSTTKTNYCN